jgi:hypothetical protein
MLFLIASQARAEARNSGGRILILVMSELKASETSEATRAPMDVRFAPKATVGDQGAAKPITSASVARME